MFIIVLGGGIDLQGKLPPHVYQRLDKAIDLFKRSSNCKIVATGKYSFLYDQLKKFPPATEAEKMAAYLLKKNIPKEKILLEKKSKDTISNAYYLKKDFFIPQKEKKGIVITSHFHLARVRYIFNKIFGPDYDLEFIGLQERLAKDEEEKVVLRQKELLIKTKKMLEPMADGDHSFLDGKFYTIDYYRQKRPPWVINFVAKGK